MNTKINELEYEFRRNGKSQYDQIFMEIYPLVRPLLRITNPEISGLERIPEEGPALILPKHQHYVDILLMWYLIRSTGRYPNYIRKSTIKHMPSMPLYHYTIEIDRKMDILSRLKKARKKTNKLFKRRHITDNERRKLSLELRKKIIKESKESNNRQFEYMDYLLEKGEVIISFPEGTFYNERVGPINPDDVIRRVIQLQDRLEEKIPIIPVGITYNGRIFSNVKMNVGNPFTLDKFMKNGIVDEKGLVKRIKEDLEILSGFK